MSNQKVELVIIGPSRVIAGSGTPDGAVRTVTEDAATLTETITPAGVTSIPTLRFHRDGTAEDFLVGARPKPVIAAKIQELLA